MMLQVNKKWYYKWTKNVVTRERNEVAREQEMFFLADFTLQTQLLFS